MTTTDQLETFRLNYPSIRVNVQDGYMVYKCGHGTADSSVRVANTYIRELKLNLKARKTSETSFVVEGNNGFMSAGTVGDNSVPSENPAEK